MDDHSNPIIASARDIGKAYVLVIEAKALLDGLQMAASKGFHHVQVEGVTQRL